MHAWLSNSAKLYHYVDFEIELEPKKRPNETSPTAWPTERHQAIINFKEEALNYGRQIWADFVFVRPHHLEIVFTLMK